MSARGSARYWLASSGIATLAMAVALWADHQPTWAVVILGLMGIVTLAGGLVQAKADR